MSSRSCGRREVGLTPRTPAGERGDGKDDDSDADEHRHETQIALVDTCFRGNRRCRETCQDPGIVQSPREPAESCRLVARQRWSCRLVSARRRMRRRWDRRAGGRGGRWRRCRRIGGRRCRGRRVRGTWRIGWDRGRRLGCTGRHCRGGGWYGCGRRLLRPCRASEQYEDHQHSDARRPPHHPLLPLEGRD